MKVHRKLFFNSFLRSMQKGYLAFAMATMISLNNVIPSVLPNPGVDQGRPEIKSHQLSGVHLPTLHPDRCYDLFQKESRKIQLRRLPVALRIPLPKLEGRCPLCVDSHDFVLSQTLDICCIAGLFGRLPGSSEYPLHTVILGSVDFPVQSAADGRQAEPGTRDIQ